MLGKSNGQSLVSLNLFVPEQIALAKVDHVYVNSMLYIAVPLPELRNYLVD